jgi:Bacterial extracellular solute-binding protein.
MFRRTKWLAVLLAVIFLVSMSACGNKTTGKNETSSAATTTATQQSTSTKAPEKEAVTITWFGGVPQASYITTGIQDDPIMNTIKEKTGVTIDHTPSIGISDQDQKAAVLIASSDMPDVMYISGIVSTVLKAKAAIPLDDLIKTNGQELEKNIGKALKASKLLKSDDTHALYFLPHKVNGSDFSGNTLENGYNIRWDLYKKLNYPKITNDDEFLKMLQDMVKLEPKNKDGKPNYGLGLFLGETWCNHMVDKAHGAYQGVVQMTTNVSIDVVNYKVVARVTDPNSAYWNSMLFYNKAYRMGLFDPESITLKFDAYVNKAKSGRYMAAECNWALGNASAEFTKEGTPEKGFVPFTYGLSEGASFGTTAGIGDQNTMFISSSCKHPDRVMDVFNYLASDEGARVIQNGPEGVNYDIKDGKPVVKDEVIEAHRTDSNFPQKYGMGKYSTMAVRDGKDSEGNNFNLVLNPEVLKAGMGEVEKDYCKYTNQSTPIENLQKYKYASYDMGLLASISIPDSNEARTAQKKGEDYVYNSYAKAIVAKTEAEYNKIKDKIIADAKALGYDKEVEYYSQIYEQYKGEIK